MLQTITLVLMISNPTKDEEDNKLRESRSRAHKALKDLCPAALLSAYSYSSLAASDRCVPVLHPMCPHFCFVLSWFVVFPGHFQPLPRVGCIKLLRYLVY